MLNRISVMVVTSLRTECRYFWDMGTVYTDLVVWQKAMDLAVDIYRLTREFPREELYGLTSQMRRCAVSVASNIAEGKGRFSKKELVQFLYRARGSLLELETQLIISTPAGYMPQEECDRLRARSAEIGRMLNGLVNRFQSATNQESLTKKFEAAQVCKDLRPET
jgi:four helix bundle protein